MSQLDIKIRKLQDNGSTFRANIETLYLGGVRSAKVDELRFELPEEWKKCTVTLHVQRLSGTKPDPQILDENNSALVDRRWTLEKEGTWMLLAINDSGYIAMTKPGKYTCYDTIDTDTTTENITPSIYEQFVAEVTKYAKQALESMNAAKTSEEAAAKSAKEAANSAASMEESVRVSGENAKKAANSAAAAKKSEEAAAKSAEASENSAKKSAESESASKASAGKAKDSEEAAKKSEDAAALSETNAAASEKNAKTSETAAKRALQDTETEHTTALQDIAQARTAALTDVANSTRTATAAAKTATQQATTAAGSASTAATKAGEAEKSKTAAATSATNAKASEEASKNWAEEAKKAANTDPTVSIKGAPADAAATRALIKEMLAAQREEDYARVRYWASNDPTSPASFIGGTWERVEGEFIMGASSAYPVGTTGGNATHTQTTAEMPSHSHSGSTGSAGSHSHSASTGSAGSHSHSGTTGWAGAHSHATSMESYSSGDSANFYAPPSGNAWNPEKISTDSAGSHTHSFSTNSTGAHSHSVSIGNAGAHTHTVSIGSTGSGQAMDILNPYYALYIWVRVDDAA